MVSPMRTHDSRSRRMRLLAVGAAGALLSTTLVATSITIPGYSATDATPYSFIDVASSGGASVLTSTDDGLASLTLPFGFTFFGTTYSNLCVSTNGAAYFSNTAGSCPAIADFANTDLSNTPTPGDKPGLFPLWSDLVLAGPGAGVYYQTQGVGEGSRKFVVQWNNAYPLAKDTGVSPNAMTFELILFEGNNQILFQYRTVDLGAANAASKAGQATIGIRDAGSVDNPPLVLVGSGKLIAWSHKSAVINDATAILFTSGKSTPVVTVTGGTAVFDGQPHGGTGNAFGTSAEPLSPVNLTYEGTGGTDYPSTSSAPSDAGSYKVTGTFPGNNQYQSGSDSAPLTITQAAQAIVFTSSPGSPVVNGAAYAVSATGGGSANAVVFSVDTPGVCALSGPSSVVFTAAGTCTINANQAGTLNYAAAPQVQQSFAVGKGTQVTVFVTGPISVTFGTTGTAAADGGNGAGAFLFSVQGTGCTLNGTTVSVINASGTCTLTATRAGDDNFLASAPSAPFDVKLDKAAQSTVTVTAPSSVTYGTTGTASATGGNGTGGYTFSAAGSTGCSVAGSTVSVTNASGSCTLTASRAGDSNYLVSSSSAPFGVTLVKASQTITFTTTPPASPTVGGSYTVGATATSGGAVSFSTLTNSICTVSTNVVSFVGAGLCTVAANQSGNNNYSAATQVTQNMTVGGGTTNYTFSGFFQPIDMSTTTIIWNSANAGRSVPVKWRLAQTGVPVSNPGSFGGIFTSIVACDPGQSSDDAVEQYTNSSGLQYLGDGNWQYNWATQRSFTGKCLSVFVRFTDGSSSPPAYFKFN
jgi:hypothetical protein